MDCAELKQEASNVPADRNTIMTLRGTSNAKTQLFRRELDAYSATCMAQRLRGTVRGFKRGNHGRGGDVEEDRVKMEGMDVNVMKSIWENVSAEPALCAQLVVNPFEWTDAPIRGFKLSSSS